MNKNFFKVVFGSLFLVVAMAFAGCSDDDDSPKPVEPKFSAAPTALEFDAAESSKTFDIKANCDWEVIKAESADWATITPTSAKGDKTVAVKVAANENEENRSLTLTFKLTDESGKVTTSTIEVTINQAKKVVVPKEPAISKVTPETLAFLATDVPQEVTVTVENGEGCTLVATATPDTQFTATVAEQVVTVTPKPNGTTEAVTGTLTILLMKDGVAVGEPVTVAISQEGAVEPEVAYVRVAALTVGKKYLIVAEVEGESFLLPAASKQNDNLLFVGEAVTPINGKIASNATNDASAVTFETIPDGYSIKNSADKFIEYNDNLEAKSQLGVSDQVYRAWNIEAQSDGTFLISDTKVTNRALLYRPIVKGYGNTYGGYSVPNIGSGYKDKS